eukprot:637159-Pleurochrysis_carterae.AAC.2
MHTDNAADLTSREMRDIALMHRARLTTISPRVPRQNGACKRQWRTLARDTRAMLATSRLPPSFWWYTTCMQQPTLRQSCHFGPILLARRGSVSLAPLPAAAAFSPNRLSGISQTFSSGAQDDQ